MPVFELMIAMLAFMFGIVVLTYFSDKAVEHSLKIAYAWRISPILIGLLLVSVGTDLPEIMHYVDRCMFCGQCAEICPKNAIRMSEEYELAGFDRSKMIYEYKRDH